LTKEKKFKINVEIGKIDRKAICPIRKGIKQTKKTNYLQNPKFNNMPFA
jgi:hypothetical protein